MKARLALVVVAIALVTTACGPGMDPAVHDYGNPMHWQVKPIFATIQMQSIETGSRPSNVGCAVSLTAAGVGAIVAVGAFATAPVGVTALAVFGGASSAVGLGSALVDCFNRYTITKPAFDVIIRCPVNKPTLVKSFDDVGQATAYIQLQTCSCSLACILGEEDPETFAPGLNFSKMAYQAGKNYYHDGANRVNGPVTGEPPPPPDYQAIADQLGIPWEGQCVEYRPSDNLCGTQ